LRAENHEAAFLGHTHQVQGVGEVEQELQLVADDLLEVVDALVALLLTPLPEFGQTLWLE
jgi:hypothetical protein